MINKLRYFLLLPFLYSACTSATVLPTSGPLTITSATSTSEIAYPMPTSLPSKTSPIRVTTSPTLTPPPIGTTIPTIQPIIHEEVDDLYETVFSLPVGGDSIIHYRRLGDTILGPMAIAFLPDDSYMIAEHSGNRLLHYDQEGRLLNQIELANLGIDYVADMRIRGTKLIILELNNQGKYLLHHLALDGTLIESDEVPESLTSGLGIGMPLAAGELSIAVDCEGNILLELQGGYLVYRLVDLQNNPDPTQIPSGYLCNNKPYQRVDAPKPFARLTAGDATYETKLTNGFGKLALLDAFPDGSFYTVRDDVVNEQVIQVDQTLHYINDNGDVNLMARVPLSEYFYPVRRNMAINSKGEAFVLLPRQDSVDIVRLNFFEALAPIIPGAVAPKMTLYED